MAEKFPRAIATIFCDDIRAEVGNKVSLMGVYSGIMFVPAFPFLLPKMCMLVTAVTSAAEPYRSLIVKVSRNDQTIFENSIQDPPNFSPPPPAELGNVLSTGEAVSIISIPIVISPFVVEGPTLLRVRGEMDGKELRCPGLIIRTAEPSEQIENKEVSQ